MTLDLRAVPPGKYARMCRDVNAREKCLGITELDDPSAEIDLGA